MLQKMWKLELLSESRAVEWLVAWLSVARATILSKDCLPLIVRTDTPEHLIISWTSFSSTNFSTFSSHSCLSLDLLVHHLVQLLHNLPFYRMVFIVLHAK